MRRALAILVALVALGSGFWLAVSNLGRSKPTQATVDPISNGRDSTPRVESASHPPDRPTEPTRVRDKTKRMSELGYVDSEFDTEDPPEVEEPPVLIDGDLVLVDESGVERAGGSGRFVAKVSSVGGQSRSKGVRVESGRFRVPIRDETGFGVDELVIDGRCATAIAARYETKSGETVHVRAIEARPVLLHVIDAMTHAELNDVVLDLDWEALFEGNRTLLAQQRSPIRLEYALLPGVSWATTLYVRAPKHVIGSTTVDFRTGGEATLELPSAGELEVTIRDPLAVDSSPPNDRRPPRAEVRLRVAPYESAAELEAEIRRRRAEDATATESEIRAALVERIRIFEEDPSSGELVDEKSANGSAPIRFDGIPPCRLVATLELGSAESPFLLSSAAVEIVAGETARVTLDMKLPPDLPLDDPSARTSRRRFPFESPEGVPLSGTLRISEKWVSPVLTLDFETSRGKPDRGRRVLRLADLERLNGSPDLYRFDAGRGRAGTIGARIAPIGFVQPIEVGAQGTDSAEIVVPDPADVIVRAIDDVTGRPIDSELNVIATFRNDQWFAVSSESTWDDAIPACRLRVPAGEIEISLSGPIFEKYLHHDVPPARVNPGPNEVALRLHANTVVILRATIDGVASPWPDPSSSSKTVLTSIEHPGDVEFGLMDNANELYYFVSGSGRYRVTVPELPGFEAVPPFEVEAEYGEKTIATVAFHRSR